eukprot:gnl/TRDRNA2_/TRDRNA2_180553_c0_seq1.p1 gnl/TRDRNA2_/TRDRNA2_180553_c0~~gnl/TRDRNA2_/TRDRNA2_180553_c0_seq1.p1  ORF type:complete len:1036 (-),score=198.18 gnl/TRDRNA2_/TRDRNA2_180553_c0_seq1:71-3178(-)
MRGQDGLLPARRGGERGSDFARRCSSEDALSRFMADREDEAETDVASKHGHINILVCVRCRALVQKELAEGGRASVKVLDGKTVILEDPQITAADDYLRLNKSKERRFAFDEAFGYDAVQNQVYLRTTQPLIPGVLQGFNATVFAYGATGAGKTFTMLGNPSQPGIMMLTLQDLFSEVAAQKEQEHKAFEVKCSFLEVYNENIRDLLRPDGEYLDVREDPVKGVLIAGISEVGGLESAKEIMALLHQANKNRMTEATAANVTSSRSHAVLQVVVEQRDRTAGIVAQVNVGKLSMIDLAGSERASVTNNRGMRMIEGANINRSLLALGNCITALSSADSFVPYRDSKMTRLLKDSLGGNCRTVMIANVTPCHLNYEDTHNTLKYASRARSIKTKAVRNVVHVNYHVSKYNQIIRELRDEVTDLKGKLAAPEPSFGSSGEPTPEMATDRINQAEAHVQSYQWKQELMHNFEQRVRTKRQLIDLAHETQSKMVEKSRVQVGISQWESSQAQARGESGDSSTHEEATMPVKIRLMQEQLQKIKGEIGEAEELTRRLEHALVENLRTAERLQAELPKRVTNKDMVAFLSLVYRIYVLEVENMELEEMNEMAAPVLQQKDLEAEALRLQIQMRDRMIEGLDRLLVGEHSDFLTKPAGWKECQKPSRYTNRMASPLRALDPGRAEESEVPKRRVYRVSSENDKERLVRTEAAPPLLHGIFDEGRNRWELPRAPVEASLANGQHSPVKLPPLSPDRSQMPRSGGPPRLPEQPSPVEAGSPSDAPHRSSQLEIGGVGLRSRHLRGSAADAARPARTPPRNDGAPGASVETPDMTTAAPGSGSAGTRRYSGSHGDLTPDDLRQRLPVVEGRRAMPEGGARRPPPGGGGGGAEGQRPPPEGQRRRRRKSRRPLDDKDYGGPYRRAMARVSSEGDKERIARGEARERLVYDRPQLHLQIEASGLQRDDSHDSSGNENGSPPHASVRDHAKDHAAERRGIIERLNRRMSARGSANTKERRDAREGPRAAAGGPGHAGAAAGNQHEELD